jgi:hypothetical protein
MSGLCLAAGGTYRFSVETGRVKAARRRVPFATTDGHGQEVPGAGKI